jgi:AcrR family transcriptional regulator
MIRAAAASFRTKGLAATSFTDVVAASGAARGAIYHHFPGGKAELAQAAVEWFGDQVTAGIRTLDRQDSGETPTDFLERFLELVRPVVAESVEFSGCPVAAVALESTRDDTRLVTVANDAFCAWTDELARLLTRSGLSSDDSTALAALMITTLEGAHILCRVAGNLEPFDRAAVALRWCLTPEREGTTHYSSLRSPGPPPFRTP